MNSLMGRKVKQSGLSMVELMVALTLGLLLTIAVLQTFIGAKKTYVFQQELSRIQENGRFAMAYLTRAIRQADFWGCLQDGADITSILNATAGISVEKGLSSSNGVSTYSPDVGPLPDLIVLRGGREGGIPVISTPSASAATIKLNLLDNPTGTTIDTGDILLVTDCERGTLFQVTNTNSANNTVVHNSGTGTPGNFQGALGYSYGTDATVYEAAAQKFWIRAGTSGEPALVRGDDYDALTGGDELVEGIENLQFVFGYDTTGDDVVDFYAPPGEGNDDDVISVQISLVARSLRDNVVDRAVQLEFNGTSYAPPSADRYLRKVFTGNVLIRNRIY